jgi:hypothetical protein
VGIIISVGMTMVTKKKFGIDTISDLFIVLCSVRERTKEYHHSLSSMDVIKTNKRITAF